MEICSVKIPSWIHKNEAENEFLKTLKIKAQLKMEFYRSKMLPFEQKYQSSFEEFQKNLKKESKEDFEKWDDLIEWEAIFKAFKEWENRYKEFD